MRLFLRRHERCPDCNGVAVELAACARCGATYAVGRIRNEAGRRVFAPALEGEARTYLLLDDVPAPEDEDEAVASEQAPANPGTDLDAAPLRLCTRCGTLVADDSLCTCSEHARWHSVRMAVPKQTGDGIKACLGCGARSGSGNVVYRMLTGQDAPVSVLATALYGALPPSVRPGDAGLPGKGRKLLVFADSRQDAAFFAPYIERTYATALRRRLLLKTLLEDPDGVAGHLRVGSDALAMALLKWAEQAGCYEEAAGWPDRRRAAHEWIMQEFVALDRRLSLEGLGLIAFRVVRPPNWQTPRPLLASPWNLSDNEAWTLVALLLDTLRQQGAVTFPNGVDPRSDAFAPRNKRLYVRQDGASDGRSVLTWMPLSGRNRRLDLLKRLLGQTMPTLTEAERKTHAEKALAGLWRNLAEGALNTTFWRMEDAPGAPRRASASA